VLEHRLTKSHRRVLRKNSDLEVRVHRPKFSREKYRLYEEYVSFKHDTSLCDSPSALKGFLYTSPVKSLEFEYRLNGRLIAVSIADICSRSLSSVYAFYALDTAERSLGTFSALKEMAFCREIGIPYYYLGFFVRDCPAMNYKSRFQPHEMLDPAMRWLAG
jgi:arginine-tRNA-protein transferase